MDKRIRAVVSDLDGSLLTDDKQISRDDLATIASLRAHGVPFFFCTGRHYDACRYFARIAELSTPAICSNGACLYDYRQKRLVYSACFLPETFRRILEYFSALRPREYFIYSKYTIYYGPEELGLPYWLAHQDYFVPEDEAHAAVCDVNFSPLRDDIMKYMLPYIGDDGRKAALRALGSAADDINLYHCDTCYTEMTKAGRNKASGIATAGELFGFAQDEVLALGDQWNDTEMLEAVGYPVAPVSGDPLAKERARYISADNNHSALTDAVRHFCPEYLE